MFTVIIPLPALTLCSPHFTPPLTLTPTIQNSILLVFSPHHVEIQYSKMGFQLAQGELLPSPTPVQIPLLFNPLLRLRQTVTCVLPFAATYYLGQVKESLSGLESLKFLEAERFTN